MFLKKLLSVILVFSFSFSLVQASPTTFDWDNDYTEAINYLYDNDLIANKAEFVAEDFVSKADFLRLILKNAGYNSALIKRKIFPNAFQDVKQTDWFTPYVFEALQKGLISGGTHFYPERELTRFEALALFFKLEGIPASLYSAERNVFKDIPRKSNFAPIASTAVRMGLILPVQQDRFGLLQKITKGEVAEMLYIFENYKINFEVTDLNQYEILSEIPQADILLDVWKKLHNEYYWSEEIDDEKMVYAAIEGMVNSIGDVFSTFMPPQEGESFTDSLDGKVEGIGAYVAFESGKIVIVAPLQNSPAEKAGLKANDQIIEVNGESVLNLPLFEVVSKIKGTEGTQVQIKILRGEQEKDFTVMREKVDIKSVGLKQEDNFAIISLNQFVSKTTVEFEDVVSEIKAKNLQGVILDLRNNPGGYLNTAVDVLGFFVPKGELILSIEYPQIIFEQRSVGETELKGLPAVVLINEGSASASEIVAGALQDLGLATIVGKTSYGKGTVQELILYVNGANLKLTVAKWLTPNGRWINGVGIVPDVDVEDDVNTTNDEQIEKAIEILNSKF